MDGQAVQIPVNGRLMTIGRYYPDESAFVQRKNRKRHYLRREKGYALDNEVWVKAIEGGVRYWRIHETDTGNTYQVEFKRAELHARQVHYSGQRLQMALPLEHFALIASTPVPGQPHQLSLL